jgi:hypothetical protein
LCTTTLPMLISRKPSHALSRLGIGRISP